MSWLHRLVNTFRPAPLERDIDREIAFHIREREEELRAGGLTTDDARRAARRHFGNTLRIREDTHRVNRVGWIELWRSQFSAFPRRRK